MQHLVVQEPVNLGNFSLMDKVALVYQSEFNYNHWSSVCLNLEISRIPQLKFKSLIFYLATFALLPIIICSHCDSCPQDATFGLEQGVAGIRLRVNSTFVIRFLMNPLCNGDNCGFLSMDVKNGYKDPIRVFVAQDLFSWKNETFVSGRVGYSLRLLGEHLLISNPISYSMTCCKKLPEHPPVTRFMTYLQPYKLHPVAVGVPL